MRALATLLLLTALLPGPALVAAAAPAAAAPAAAAPAAAPPSPLPAEATGDRRVVTEPVIPSATCATLSAQLAMPDRQATDAEEQHAPDTARIQQALDACSGTDAAIRLTPADGVAAFLSGPLHVRPGEVLVVDPAVTLYASRVAADYRIPSRSVCGTISGDGDGCLPFISVGSHAGVESGRTADGPLGRIDGRGDLAILGTSTSWWDLAKAAKSSGHQNVPRLIRAQRADDVTVSGIELENSPGAHVVFDHGDGLTVWGVIIRTPSSARNTDGIDPGGAQDVTITQSYVMDGDDGVAIKAANEASAHITVSDNVFLGTHGISIGGQTTAGVSDVLVTGNTLSGKDADGVVSRAAAGIRIKSSSAAGGVVQDVTFRDTCVDLVKAPIDFDTRYESRVGSHVPVFTRITVDGFRATSSVRGAASVLQGFDAARPLGVVLRRTEVDDPDVRASFADITDVGARFGGAPLAAAGPGVHVTTRPGSGNPPGCGVPATFPRGS